MPSARKIAWAQLRVGIMAVIALIIIGVLVFLLTGTKKIFTEDTKIYTYLKDSAALAKGSPVRLNGILIGSVERVELSGEQASQRQIRVHLEVEQEMLKQIPVDSLAAIAAENVLGAKFINISRGVAAETIQPGGEVRALDTADFDEMMRQGNSMLAQLQGILKRVDAIVALVEVGKGSIGKLLVDEELYNRLIAIMADSQKISKALASPQGTIGKLIYDDALHNDTRQLLARFDTLLVELQQGKGTAGKFLKDDAVYQEIRASVAEMRKLIEDLNAGKGTAGKILKSEELHNQFRASLEKIDLLIEKVNSGQGTIGQLLVNRQLYDTLNGATGEMQQLLKDIRANPKKFLRIKLALFLKKLVVNADDYGYTRDVNDGIVEAHARGILTATTLMANGAAFDDAVTRAREHPELDVGVHLVLVGGGSLLTGLPLPRGVYELTHAVMRRTIRPYDELKPQIERVLGAGIRPTHLDTHKHTHLMPAILDAVARLSEEYRILWVRRPFDFPLSAGRTPWTVRVLSASMRGLRPRFHSTLERRGCRVTDHFAGFQLTGRFRTAELVTLIRSLPEGVTEFMCHPGRCTEELRGMPTRLKDSREEELKALLAPEVRQAIGEQGVQLARYRDL